MRIPKEWIAWFASSIMFITASKIYAFEIVERVAGRAQRPHRPLWSPLGQALIMSRPQFFIIVSAIIFLLERVLPVLVSWPIFVFPVFIIIFLLTSKSDTREISYIAIAALVFDFFSGYTFGFSTLAILVITLAIFLFKTHFNVNQQSFTSLAIYSLVFIFAYFAILSVKSEPRLILTKAPAIIIETVILFLIIFFASPKLKNSLN